MDETITETETQPEAEATTESQPAENAEVAAPAQRAGRPRPTEVVARDAKVFEYLNAQRDEQGTPVGKTREEVAAALGVEGKQVYLSFYRLKRDGKISKAGGAGAQKWFVIEQAAA